MLSLCYDRSFCFFVIRKYRLGFQFVSAVLGARAERQMKKILGGFMKKNQVQKTTNHKIRFYRSKFHANALVAVIDDSIRVRLSENQLFVLGEICDELREASAERLLNFIGGEKSPRKAG